MKRNVTRTARAIDTPRSNLYKKMEQYDIRRAHTVVDAEEGAGDGDELGDA